MRRILRRKYLNMELAKNKLGIWTVYEVAWLSTFSAIAAILTVIWQDSFWGFTVFFSGVLCVVLAAKGIIWTYAFGMYNTFGYAYLAYQNGLYGELGLNLLFFVPMNIVGFFMWKDHLDSKENVRMLKLGMKKFLVVVAGCLLSILILGYGLSMISTQNTPYIDAITNVLSVVATLLMVKRYKEQWIIYILINIFTIVMWSIRAFNGSGDAPLMIVMWSAYLINAIYGYYVWNKGAKTI